MVTLGVFLCYAAMGIQLMDFVADDSISIIPRLLLNAAVQFGVAGLGIIVVCVLRKEKFIHFGLTRKKFLNQSLGQLYVLSLPSVAFFYRVSSMVISLSAF